MEVVDVTYLTTDTYTTFLVMLIGRQSGLCRVYGPRLSFSSLLQLCFQSFEEHLGPRLPFHPDLIRVNPAVEDMLREYRMDL